MSIYRNFINIVQPSLKNVRFASCWSCGQEVNKLIFNLFCPSCQSLQKPNDNKNYFKVMGLKESFKVDTEELAKTYKNLQKYLHPDKYANKNQEELAISESYSSLVNEAYHTLIHPLNRGIYLLQLKGYELPEKSDLNNEFLSKIMEINEEVDDAVTEKDIMKLKQKNKDFLQEMEKKVAKAFFDGDMDLVIKLLSELKYYTSIENQIQSKIRSKGIVR